MSARSVARQYANALFSVAHQAGRWKEIDNELRAFVELVDGHAELQQVFENLMQYSTSGVPAFLQRGAVAALDQGDPFVEEQIARARIARDLVCERLLATGRVNMTPPEGAFYAFFKIDGISDARKAAFDIVDNANVGLAPGTAFGVGGEDGFRLCFHRRLDHVEEAADRLAKWIRTA